MFLLKMVAALTVRSTGTRPAHGLTGIGGRKHARFVDGTVRRGPAAQPTDPGPEPCRPVHHQLALGRAPGGDQVPSRSRTTARYRGQGSWSTQNRTSAHQEEPLGRCAGPLAGLPRSPAKGPLPFPERCLHVRRTTRQFQPHRALRRVLDAAPADRGSLPFCSLCITVLEPSPCMGPGHAESRAGHPPPNQPSAKLAGRQWAGSLPHGRAAPGQGPAGRSARRQAAL